MNPYPLLYRLGITPWDREEVPGPLVSLADEMPAGRAIDLGCGTGRDAVYLASRGWAVTGVDGVAQAMDRARRRATTAGVDVHWVLGDVTRLESLGLPGAYTLILDRGCFHGFSDAERARYAAGLQNVSAPGTVMLLFAFQPRRFGLGPRGIRPEELQRLLAPAWQIESQTPERDLRLPVWLGDVNAVWYRLRRS